MNNRYVQIFKLYFTYGPFRLLAGAMASLAVLFRVSMRLWYYSLADEFFSFFIVASVWLAFTAGVMLKRQTAHPRASLLPGYRQPHLVVFNALFLVFFGTFMYWLAGLYPLIIVQPVAVWSVAVLSTFLVAVVIALGYLSVNILVYLFYFFMLFISWNTYGLVMYSSGHVHWHYIFGALTVVIIAVLNWRALVLTEDAFEYGYIIAWPPKDF